MTKEEKKKYDHDRYIANITKKKKQRREYYAAHREDGIAKTSAWIEANREKHNSYSRKSNAKNIVRKYEYDKKWWRDNKNKARIYRINRRILESEATPPWASHDEILSVYEEAYRLQQETGTKFHVDHIWPLHGNGFNGLHVPWNLRAIPAVENLRKNNKRPDEMGISI